MFIFFILVPSVELKKLKTTVENLFIEKQKIEKGDKSKKNKGKGKAKLKIEGENVSKIKIRDIYDIVILCTGKTYSILLTKTDLISRLLFVSISNQFFLFYKSNTSYFLHYIKNEFTSC